MSWCLWHYFGNHKDLYFLFFISLKFCYWNQGNLPRLRGQQHLQLHFVTVEVTRNILIYELDLLYIFDINIYLIFNLINVIIKYSPWDRGQTGIKLGADYIIHQKLESFMYKKDIHDVNRIESGIFGMQMYILQSKTKCKGGTEFWRSL